MNPRDHARALRRGLSRFVLGALVATVLAIGAVGAAPRQGVGLSLVSQSGGLTAGLHLLGQRVVAGQGANLVVLDAAPGRPVTVAGSVVLPGVVQGLAVEGRYAYLAAQDAGLQIVDLADPTAPRVVGSLVDAAGARAWAVFAEGSRVVLAERTDVGDQLTIVDVTQPAAPRELGYYEPLDGIIEGVWVQGNRAYLVNGQMLWIVDLTVPAAPQELGTYEQMAEPIAVTVAGSRAYVTDVRFSPTDFRYIYTVRVLDVSNPAAPAALGGYQAAGTVRGVVVMGDTMYLARADALEIVNASNPPRPQSLGEHALAGGAVAIGVEGSRVVVAPGAGGVTWLDATNPGAIQELAVYVVPVAAHDVAVAGNVLCLVENIVASGLRLMDVSDPAAPKALGYLPLPGEAWRVALADGHAYVADGLGGLRIVDISDPRNPRQVGAYLGVDDVLDVAIMDQHAYLAASGNGLRVVDVSDPRAPQEVGAFELPDQAFGVAAAAGRVYIAGRRDVRIMDVSDPADPQPVAGIAVEPFLYHLAVVNNRLYVPTDLGLRIIDVTDPTQTVDLGLIPIADGANDVEVAGNMAYVTSAVGVHAVDLSRGQEVSRYLTPAFAEGLAVSGGLVHTAVYDAGLFVLQLGAVVNTPTPPRTTATGTAGTPTATPPEPTPTAAGPRWRLYLPIAQQP